MMGTITISQCTENTRANGNHMHVHTSVAIVKLVQSNYVAKYLEQ